MRVSEIFYSLSGEGVHAGIPTVFIRLAGCNLRCNYCLAPETPVLMSDFTYKPLGDLVVGNVLWGVDRNEDGKQLRYVPATVLATHKRVTETVKLSGSFGEVVCTSDHKFLYTKHREYWQNASSLEGHELMFVGHLPCDWSEFKRGWLAGYIAGDGNFHEFTGAYSFVSSGKTYLRFKVTSKDEELIDNTIAWAGEFGFVLRRVAHSAGSKKFPAVESTRAAEVRRFRDFLYSGDETPDYARGYLAGAYDAEGTPQGNEVRIAQRINSSLRDDVLAFAKALRFSVSEWLNGKMSTIRILDPLRFYVECPSVLGRKKLLDCSIKTTRQRSEVSVVEVNGRHEVCDLTTSTGNYIAQGLIVHNCDTQYAWDGGEEKSVDNIMYSIVTTILPFQKRWALITGGEPLLQDIRRLVHALKSNDFLVEVETNGSIDPPSLFKLVDCWSVDVKCPSSGPSYGTFKLSWLRKMRKQDQLKFVVGTQEDLNFVRGFLNGLRIKPTVLISPVAKVDNPPGNWNSEWLQECVEFCKQQNVRMSLQLHKIIYGDKRGV